MEKSIASRKDRVLNLGENMLSSGKYILFCLNVEM